MRRGRLCALFFAHLCAKNVNYFYGLLGVPWLHGFVGKSGGIAVGVMGKNMEYNSTATHGIYPEMFAALRYRSSLCVKGARYSARQRESERDDKQWIVVLPFNQ